MLLRAASFRLAHERECAGGVVMTNPLEKRMAETSPISVVETPEFLSATRRGIYFHHDAGMPLFALTAFAKSDRGDLSKQDRNDFRCLTALLVKAFKRRNHEQGRRQHPARPQGSGGL